MQRKAIAIAGGIAGAAAIVAVAGGLVWAHGDWRGDKFARFCSDERVERIDYAIEKVRREVNPTEAQLPAWNRLTEAVREGDLEIAARCDEFKDAGRAATAPEKLARAEAAMTTGLSIMETVRPALDDFYGTLSDEQKRTVDSMMKHRRHHHGHGYDSDYDDDYDDDRDD